MSNKNTNAAAEAVAALKKDYEEKLSALNGLPETATAEEKADAQSLVDKAKEALELAEKQKGTTPVEVKEKLIKGKFLLSPTGRFNLAYNAGESASLPELQANELEEAGYFKFDK